MATEGMAVRELVDALEAREDLAAIPGVHNQLREKLTQDDVMSPLASSPELLSRLLGTLMKHAACSEEALSLEALSTLGALAHRKDVCSAFSGEQVRPAPCLPAKSPRGPDRHGKALKVGHAGGRSLLAVGAIQLKQATAPDAAHMPPPPAVGQSTRQ